MEGAVVDAERKSWSDHRNSTGAINDGSSAHRVSDTKQIKVETVCHAMMLR